MRKLTNKQTIFLLEYFFKDERFAGWANIASTLLQEGECIVPGEECIWKDGIGNFIKTEPYKNAIDCLLYKFDLENFLKSEWFKEVHRQYVGQLAVIKNETVERYNEIVEL